MATWKKIVVSGSNVSQLNNDAGYLTAGTLGVKNAFSTASFNGTYLVSDSTTGSLNFASSSGQGLDISANAGTDTLTFGLSAIPNSSLLNSSVTVGSTNIALGATSTTLAGLTSVTSTGFTGSLQGTASWANNATTATNATNTAITDTTAGTGPYYITFVASNTGNQPQLVDSSTLTYNATTNTITATSSYANQALSASFASTAPYSGLTGVPSGIVSGSSQVTALLPAGTVSGSSQISYSGITGVPAGIVSASVLSSPGQGQALLTTNGVAGSTIDLGLETGDSPSFAGVTAGNIKVGITNDNQIDTVSGDITVNSNLILNKNLTVIGTASFQQTSNLQVSDRFVLFASGSNTTGDGGFIVQQATQDVGELFGWDSGTSRWAVTSSFSADQGAFTPDAFVSIVSNAAATTPAPATRYNAAGNIYVSSGDESIWIYS